MKKTFKAAAIAIATLAGAYSSQASTINASLGDLVLGFRVASTGSNPGFSLNLEVDLGSAATFYNATPGSSFTLPGLTLADLTGIYGSGWNTRTDLSWGVVGTVGATATSHALANTVWLTKAESTPGTQTTPYNVLSNFGQQSVANTIAPLVTNSGSVTLAGATSTANSATAASLDATQSGSWTIQEGSGTTSFGFNASGLLDNTTNIASGSSAISDLYELQPSSAKGPATYLGYFSLSNAGVLTFTAAPEPSSVALALIAGAGALVVRRRRA